MRRIVQVGTGAWGESWATIVQRSADWELAGLVDVDEAALARVGEAVGIESGGLHTSLRSALEADRRIEAALIVVPPAAHEAVALEALGAGLHCLIEKPLADDMRSAARIASAASDAGRRAMVSQNYRFKRGPRTVRRLISTGTVGPVERVTIRFEKDPPFTGFRLEMDEPLITDMAIHHLDQVRGTLGLEPATIRARSWNPSWSRFAGNACCQIELDTDSGARVTYTGSWVSPGEHTTWDGAWDIQGARGSIGWADNRVEIRFASLFDTVFMEGALERAGVMHVDLDWLRHEERLGSLAELATAIDEDREPETSAADNLRSLALVLGAVRSAKADGEPVEISSLLPALTR